MDPVYKETNKKYFVPDYRCATGAVKSIVI